MQRRHRTAELLESTGWRRLDRLDSVRRAGATGRITKIERAGMVTKDREKEWLAMAERNVRLLYEQALLRSANPTHALMGDPPPG